MAFTLRAGAALAAVILLNIYAGSGQFTQPGRGAAGEGARRSGESQFRLRHGGAPLHSLYLPHGLSHLAALKIISYRAQKFFHLAFAVPERHSPANIYCESHATSAC
ncbi:hypothetical protein [Sphingobium sp. DC-2]|uniref:hypothetical protein n=1 Tax=Sphingobium sp. DC-2 TaxID=1303256 RepID=UPI0004C45BFD|nr:hypothetical protein [Sphingobium sp. DC-2]